MVISSNEIKLSSAISDVLHIEKTRWIFKDYIDNKEIPYYIHSGGDIYDVGGSDIQTLDSSEYKDFIVDIFTSIDELIDLDFIFYIKMFVILLIISIMNISHDFLPLYSS